MLGDVVAVEAEPFGLAEEPGLLRVLLLNGHPRRFSKWSQIPNSTCMLDLALFAGTYPTACSTLPPTATGFASMRMKAIAQGSVPLLTQL